MYVASGGSDFSDGDSLLQDRLYLNDGKWQFEDATDRLPKQWANHSVVTATDFDADGDLDLFIGGHASATAYPDAAESQLLENQEGRFVDVTEAWAPALRSVGLVQCALWTDYDANGRLDLIVSGEWMPIRVFNNTGTQLVEQTTKLGLMESNGWWNSIVGADFDRDGDIDYVLGNQGENLRYKPKNGYPLEAFAADFDQDEDVDFVLSYYYEGQAYPIAHLDDLAGELPFVTEQFRSYTLYGSSTTREVIGEQRLQQAQRLQAHTFASSYIENRGAEGMRLRPLPVPVQMSSVYGLLVADYNHDGHDDILLHGNYHAFQPQFEKQSAGTGFFLLGDGTGNFESQWSRESGFWNAGEGRALASWWEGGESVVVAANNNDGCLFYSFSVKNQQAITLNPNEYVAIFRLVDGSMKRVECYYGEGYLTQRSRRLFFDPAVVRSIELKTYVGDSRILLNKQ